MRHWTTTHEVSDYEIDVDGTLWNIDAEITISWERDQHYGVDSDGRRGVAATVEVERTIRVVCGQRCEPDGRWSDCFDGHEMPDAVHAAAELALASWQPSDDEADGTPPTCPSGDDPMDRDEDDASYARG